MKSRLYTQYTHKKAHTFFMYCDTTLSINRLENKNKFEPISHTTHTLLITRRKTAKKVSIRTNKLANCVDRQHTNTYTHSFTMIIGRTTKKYYVHRPTVKSNWTLCKTDEMQTAPKNFVAAHNLEKNALPEPLVFRFFVCSSCWWYVY